MTLEKGIKGKVGRKLIVCVNCGENKEQHAFGLCKTCYNQHYRKTHRAQIRIQKHQYREEHIDYIRKRDARYYQENLDYMRKRNARYYQNNQEGRKEYIHCWLKNNPDKDRIYGFRRRARKMDAEGFASVEQILGRVEYYGSLCYLCGKPYEAIDHVIPLSKGGSNWPANQRPICISCNSRKGTRLLQEIRL